MAKFRFQLEGVLAHRKHIEQQRQRELATLQLQMQQWREELAAMDQSVKQATAELRRDHLVGRIDLAYLTAHRRFVESMERKAINLAQKMAALQRQVDQARAALGDAAKQRKIMEKLRERQWQRWTAHLDKLEREEMDEIGMQLSYRHLADQEEEIQAGGAA